MTLPKRYKPQEAEIKLQNHWMDGGVYEFVGDGDRRIFAIDTPPATVSGRLHLGHVFSYSQADFIARYHRMMG